MGTKKVCDILEHNRDHCNRRKYLKCNVIMCSLVWGISTYGFTPIVNGMKAKDYARSAWALAANKTARVGHERNST